MYRLKYEEATTLNSGLLLRSIGIYLSLCKPAHEPLHQKYGL